MGEQADDVLDDLVMACLERVETEGAAAIESCCREHPELADELRARMAALADAGLLGEPDAPPERLGEFRLGRRLGGGGMGVVYAAVQEPLEREVALKIVRSDQLYFPGARERFRRELQLVARLAHAGIVPVYSAGEADGVPYFAMERLQGATLAEALAVLDAPPRTGAELAEAVERVVESRDGERARVQGSLFEGDGVSTCVRIVRRVAQALAHAHERGVLHRDIKPSNVMLTTDGRALLFDFGLASSADAVRVTRSGSRVGSLAYMSPEQVRGEVVDERSDVCGLGALLCELLTLQPPHAGGAEAVGAAILRGDPVPIRARRRDVPRDVETVVQTALALRPEHRYASADALAHDLGNVLARRPIEARRTSAPVRSLRWAQRHPARAALLVLLVLVPIGFAVQQNLAAREVARQRDRAEANLDGVLAALDTLVWGLGDEFLEHAPGQQAEHVELLEGALASLDGVIPQRPDDARLRGQWVRVRVALGEAALAQGELDTAEAHLRAALEVATAHDVDDSARLPVLNAYGNLLIQRQRHAEAADVLLEAAQLADAERGLPALQRATISLRNASRSLVRVGRLEEALLTADASIDRAELALAAAATDDERFDASHDLGAALTWRAGVVVATRGLTPVSVPQDATARAAYARALPLLLALVDERPRRSDVVHEAVAVCTTAPAYLPPEQAVPIMRRGLELADQLCADFPERAVYAMSRVELLTNLGEASSRAGRQGEAHALFEQAARQADVWLERDAGNLGFLEHAAFADVNLAVSLVQLERRGEACEPAARGATRLEALLGQAPESPRLRASLALARVQEGHCRVAQGDLGRALQLAEAIPADGLGDPVLAVSAGEILAGCAALCPDAGEASRLAERALDRLAQGVGLGFAAPDYLRAASEWDGLRGRERFEGLVRAAGGR